MQEYRALLYFITATKNISPEHGALGVPETTGLLVREERSPNKGKPMMGTTALSGRPGMFILCFGALKHFMIFWNFSHTKNIFS